jgi:hypothetical protein
MSDDAGMAIRRRPQSFDLPVIWSNLLRMLSLDIRKEGERDERGNADGYEGQKVTINRKAFQTPQKIWYSVMWTRKGPRSYTDLEEAKRWCNAHAGVYRGDWCYHYGPIEFKFRDPDMALLFQLTWC